MLDYIVNDCDVRDGRTLKKLFNVEYYERFRVKAAKKELELDYIVTPLGLASYEPRDNSGYFSDAVCKDIINGEKFIIKSKTDESFVRPYFSLEWAEERKRELLETGIESDELKQGVLLDVKIDNSTYKFEDNNDDYLKYFILKVAVGLLVLVGGISTIIYKFQGV